jgi:hypothetical protein
MADEYISGEKHKEIKQKSNNKKVTLRISSITTIVIVVVLCLISFFIGSAYGKHSGKSVTSSAATSTGVNGYGGRYGEGERRMGGFGKVTSISSSNITISNERTNASTTYSITSNTTITDSGQTATVSDIQDGDTVIVTTASSTSTSATRIMVNPSFGGGFGGGATSGSSTTGSNSTGSNTTGSQTTN